MTGSEGRRPLPTLTRAALLLVRAYQLTFSVLVGRQCRYLPTCSDYAADAIGHYGPWVGGWMATARLCRCHPWGSSGYDPVPIRCDPVAIWRPWRHGVWRMPSRSPPGQERASNSAAKP